MSDAFSRLCMNLLNAEREKFYLNDKGRRFLVSNKMSDEIIKA